MVFCRFSGKKPWFSVDLVVKNHGVWLRLSLQKNHPREPVGAGFSRGTRSEVRRLRSRATGKKGPPFRPRGRQMSQESYTPVDCLYLSFPTTYLFNRGFFQTYTIWFNIAIWLVVYLNLWKIWKSVGSIIPNLWKIIQMFQTTNQIPLLIAYYLGLIGSTTTWLKLGLL